MPSCEIFHIKNILILLQIKLKINHCKECHALKNQRKLSNKVCHKNRFEANLSVHLPNKRTYLSTLNRWKIQNNQVVQRKLSNIKNSSKFWNNIKAVQPKSRVVNEIIILKW